MALPVASPVAYNHDGLSSAKSTIPSVNRVYEILPVSSVPPQPWNGSLNQIEFELPKYLGKIIESVLYFEVSLSTSAGTGALALLPTTGWLARTEILYNSSVVESIEPYDVHTETVSYSTDQELNLIAATLNLNANGNYAAPHAVSTAAVTKAFYLPLWANFFATCQPYVKGFASSWRIRLTFANSITLTDGTTGSVNPVGLTQLKLYATEANVSDGADAGLAGAHMSGITYQSVIRNKFTKSEPSIPNSSQYNQVMTTFTTDTAGLLLYVKPDSASPNDFLATLPLDKLELRDSANSQLTITLPAGLVESYIMPYATPINSSISLNSNYSIYLFPFCNNVLSVLESGANTGGLSLSGQEKIVFTPVSNLTTVKVNVVSYEYAIMTVRGGEAKIMRHS
jgi:hypothetical protein